MSDEVRTCRCGKTFVMRAHAVSGKPSPITTYPVENGNVAVLPDGRYRIIKKGEDYDGPRFVSHFTDCEFSREFKR